MDEKNSIIDIEKVERMARDRGMDLTQMSVSCGLSKDVLMLAIWNGISIEEVKERIVKDYISKLNIQTDAMTLGGVE